MDDVGFRAAKPKPPTPAGPFPDPDEPGPAPQRRLMGAPTPADPLVVMRNVVSLLRPLDLERRRLVLKTLLEISE